MSFSDGLEEMRKIAEYVYAEGVALRDKYKDDAPREEIVQHLRDWITRGTLVLRSSIGTRTEIAAKIKDGEIFSTSFSSIMATDKTTRDKFETYVTCKRIMDTNRLSVYKNLHTQYAVNKAVCKGNIERVDNFGSAITLYVV